MWPSLRIDTHGADLTSFDHLANVQVPASAAFGTGCDQRYVPAERVEKEVAKAYGMHAARFRRKNLVRTREQIGNAVGGLRDQAERQLRRQRLRLAKVETEKERLLHAYYENAIPVDLLKHERERLAGEQLQAEVAIEVAERSGHEVGETLDKAIDLLGCFAPSYEVAHHHLKRRWNQALFARFEIVDDEVLEPELADPSRASRPLPRGPRRLEGKPRTVALLRAMVPIRRF